MQALKEKGNRGTPDFPFETYSYEVMSSDFITATLHWHPEIELIYIENGEISISIGDEKLTAGSGDICFVNPEELHSLCTKSDTVEYYAAVFLPQLISYCPEHYFNQSFLTPLTENKIRLPGIITKEHFIYEDILPLAEAVFNPFATKADVLSCLTVLFCTMIDNNLMVNTPGSFCKHSQCDDIKLCIDYMNKNYHKKIKLAELASLIHISPNYFCNYFKDYTGTSPFGQLNYIRIRKACTLLSTGNDTIANIAKNCGFENMSFFIKKFKEVMGCTPSAYRKEMTNTPIII
ncbi:MAG: helix-turn-helix transcriptional regulator [Clostridia bacterium]|nr:helix-turn-helix transcriptional regulator [Clostridia bacterium]